MWWESYTPISRSFFSEYHSTEPLVLSFSRPPRRNPWGCDPGDDCVQDEERPQPRSSDLKSHRFLHVFLNHKLHFAKPTADKLKNVIAKEMNRIRLLRSAGPSPKWRIEGHQVKTAKTSRCPSEASSVNTLKTAWYSLTLFLASCKRFSFGGAGGLSPPLRPKKNEHCGDKW